jgi:O-antigen ligase
MSIQNRAKPLSDSVAQLVVAWALMIPLVYFASDGGFWFQSVDANNQASASYGSLVGSSHTFENVAVAAIIFFVVLIAAFRRITSSVNLMIRDRSFLALCILALVSSVWSQDPLLSLRWSIVLMLNTIFVFYLFYRFSFTQQLKLLLQVGWVCLGFSLILSLAFPAYGVDHHGTADAWRGMYITKNLCAMATLYMLPSALCLPTKGAISMSVRGVYVLLSAFLIYMSHSVSSQLALICLPLFLYVVRVIQKLTAKTRALAVLIAIVVTCLLASVVAAYSDVIVYALGRDPSLTGRTEIWSAIFISIMRRPLLGYGYRAFWTGYVGESTNANLFKGSVLNSAHNGLLEVWLGLGLVGVVLVVYICGRALRDASVCLFSEGSFYIRWCLCILFLTIAGSADEGELAIPNNLMWMLFVLACVGLSSRSKRIRLGGER